MNRIKFTLFLFSSLLLLNHAFANNGLPDPTRPANWVDSTQPVIVEQVAKPGQKIQWQVSAIRISPGDRTAIVNGKLVRVGDKISSGEIIEINPLSVVVDHEKKKLIVRLFNDSVKKDYKSSK